MPTLLLHLLLPLWLALLTPAPTNRVAALPSWKTRHVKQPPDPQLWAFKAGAGITPALPLLWEGMMILSTQDSSTIAVNATTGQ